MKRTIVLALIIGLMLGMTSVSANEVVRLSEMSDEECLLFVEECGVELPSWFESDMDWIPFIRKVISMVEEDPNVVFGFGHTDLLNLAEDIKTAVRSYYGYHAVALLADESSTNILVDNIVYGTWSSTYSNYNCYAYAIGRTTMLDPGDLSGNTYTQIPSTSTLAQYAKEDLEELGYTGVYVSSNMHTTSHHTRVICIRKGTFYDEDNLCMVTDYHVMKCESNGLWYHKPGHTNPLQYKYAPNREYWYYESFDGTTYRRDESIRYSGEIWYVVYTTPHTYQYIYRTGDTHIRTCTICGETTGEVQSCVYVNNTCRFCGHYKPTSIIVPSCFASTCE